VQITKTGEGAHEEKKKIGIPVSGEGNLSGKMDGRLKKNL